MKKLLKLAGLVLLVGVGVMVLKTVVGIGLLTWMALSI